MPYTHDANVDNIAVPVTVYLHPTVASLLDALCDDLELGRSEVVGQAVIELAKTEGVLTS